MVQEHAGLIFRDQKESWPLKMRPRVCPETSVMNWLTSFVIKTEESSSELLRGGSVNSSI